MTYSKVSSSITSTNPENRSCVKKANFSGMRGKHRSFNSQRVQYSYFSFSVSHPSFTIGDSKQTAKTIYHYFCLFIMFQLRMRLFVKYYLFCLLFIMLLTIIHYSEYTIINYEIIIIIIIHAYIMNNVSLVVKKNSTYCF